ncbi:hypothetical protein HYW76_03120 [Candidatus Pacearchaeota archaeon]|nr:hypothetical protein [Candidatus Pacearchaeota archaeon]
MKEKIINNMGKILAIISLTALLVLSLVSAVDTPITKNCCEKTTYGAFCQNAPAEQCDKTGSWKSTPTSCESTSFCKLGCCYDSDEGVCMENTAQRVCQDAKGSWSDSKTCDIAQCKLGCCVLGKQAAFVTLTRCKKLSGFYGLLTDFRQSIGSELECVSLASLSDEGACVYGVDYIQTCKFTTRQECNSVKQGGNTGNGSVTGNVTFHKDFLCSAEELGTNCGPTKDTMCIDGKDEVYYRDSCGNPANIYDAGKAEDNSYWRKKIGKGEACNPANANTNSKTCGNCNYFEGSICKDYKKISEKPVYGNNICVDLNCKTTSDSGKPHKHGESWCSTDKNVDSVGSRYIRHICMNAEEIIEPCADFRQEICIQDFIESKGVRFSQAGCRVNRWQDCYSQKERIDCENTDKRDCVWKEERKEVGNKTLACFPKFSPGLKFWEEGESQGICSAASTQCVVEFEKQGFIRGEEKCVKNCDCLTDEWKSLQLEKCELIGDCGAKINFIGIGGYKAGYKFSTKKVKEKND